jgi:endonuclease III
MDMDENDLKRNYRVTVRFTKEEYDRLLQLTKDSLDTKELSISKLIRQNVFHENQAKYLMRIASDIRRLRVEMEQALRRYETLQSDFAEQELLNTMQELNEKLNLYEKEMSAYGNNDSKKH